MRVPPKLRTAWPHVRAALILFHLLAMVLIAFPAPVGGEDRSAWKNPGVQEELHAWAARFGVAPDVFEDRLYAAAIAYLHGRARVLAPFDRYVDWTGCDQPWRMFAGPDRYPARFQIQAREKEGGDWETLYEERSAEYTWRRELFDQERVRSQVFRWSWPEWYGEANQACHWIARQRFEEDAAAVEVRCRFFRAQSPTAAQVRAHQEPEARLDAEFTVPRKPAMPAPTRLRIRGFGR